MKTSRTFPLAVMAVAMMLALSVTGVVASVGLAGYELTRPIPSQPAPAPAFSCECQMRITIWGTRFCWNPLPLPICIERVGPKKIAPPPVDGTPSGPCL
jgi:hypothetical protein